MCVRESDSVKACVCARESACVRERESVCVRERESVSVCARERDCVCVCGRESVCVCERERVCWEELNYEVRRAWHFRFDWFVKSRSPKVLQSPIGPPE